MKSSNAVIDVVLRSDPASLSSLALPTASGRSRRKSMRNVVSRQIFWAPHVCQ
jgi:hypothetical protein